nr:hypothetical protein [Tanacetum cinerariifolium]
ELRSSPGVPAHFDNLTTTLLQTLDLTVHDLDSLDTALDLNYLLSCLVDDLWASELSISNLSPNLGKDEGTSFAFDLHALRFFNAVQFVVNLDFIERYSKRFIYHAFLSLRDVKRTMDST